MKVPSGFATGYDRACALDPALAHLYIIHMRIGDPDADAAIADLSGLPPEEAQRFLRAGIELQEDVLREAPRSLQTLVHEAATLPPWYDREAALQGCRAFLRNSNALLGAYLGGAFVEGFSTRISGSYAVTGRLAEDGVRRLKQNLRQLLDIFMPRGVEPSGEGWRVTLHIRLVHAKARMLLAGTDEWNGDEWGVPVSAAHVAMGAAALSARLIEFAANLGADLDRSDREGIMAVWSCAAHVIGVPDALTSSAIRRKGSGCSGLPLPASRRLTPMRLRWPPPSSTASRRQSGSRRRRRAPIRSGACTAYRGSCSGTSAPTGLVSRPLPRCLCCRGCGPGAGSLDGFSASFPGPPRRVTGRPSCVCSGLPTSASRVPAMTCRTTSVPDASGRCRESWPTLQRLFYEHRGGGDWRWFARLDRDAGIRRAPDCR